MIEHEPCASRGDCYHARGGHNQPREAKVRGGRIGGRLGSREGKACGGRKYVELHGPPGTPESHKKGGRIQGRKNVESGHLAFIVANMARTKPTIPEVAVWSYLTFDFGVFCEFQPKLPFPNAGQPDFRVKNLLGEFDGRGHHAFGDRTEKDARFDTIRKAYGYKVIREIDPWILAAKLMYVEMV